MGTLSTEDMFRKLLKLEMKVDALLNSREGTNSTNLQGVHSGALSWTANSAQRPPFPPVQLVPSNSPPSAWSPLQSGPINQLQPPLQSQLVPTPYNSHPYLSAGQIPQYAQYGHVNGAGFSGFGQTHLADYGIGEQHMDYTNGTFHFKKPAIPHPPLTQMPLQPFISVGRDMNFFYKPKK
ncbi:uncharacterized protein LOC129585170 isoform X2 [Paramacrobiotus metropolitanus]|nr:uncharacterized protein LOC129585170 isoform X2 [Paramacrobiotus metropolitanus]